MYYKLEMKEINKISKIIWNTKFKNEEEYLEKLKMNEKIKINEKRRIKKEIMKELKEIKNE